MKIEHARKLKIRQIVYFPADRGDKAGYGRVTHIGAEPRTHMNGPEFLWVTVELPDKLTRHVWPSNRLS